MTLLANAYLIFTLMLGWFACASVEQETAQAPGEPYLLQDVVTWDAQSIKIYGERVMIFSAEVHPFRLPSPSLWLDILQKVKAIGLNTVSIYIDWALLEGKPGEFSSEGVFSIKRFFDAAVEAGVWVIARPGPYINAEVSGGGFPGWLQRLNGTLRDRNDAYINATSNYATHINKIIADAQITNGGPVILYQPENEYFLRNDQLNPDPPDAVYITKVVRQARDVGIVVPLHSNDGDEANFSRVIFPGPGEVDMIGYDAYPLGFDCWERDGWRQLPWWFDGLPHKWHDMHDPNGPLSTPEFQGGAYTSWSGAGPEVCVDKFNQEFERVYYKDLYQLGFSIINIYMTFGGTNWGNLGMPFGPTTYDYGAAIAEDRAVNREKYSELKLQAQMLKVAPGYLTTQRDTNETTWTESSGVVVGARLNRNATDGHFFIARQEDLNSNGTVEYTLNLPTSRGMITVPQLGGKLRLHGRDSKVHVTDFDVGGTKVLYSTAEIFTWKQFDGYRALLVYAGPNELHEVAVEGGSRKVKMLQGSSLRFEAKNGYVVFQYHTTKDRQVVQIDDLQIYFLGEKHDLFILLAYPRLFSTIALLTPFSLDRNSAYKYWVTDLPGSGEKLPPSYGTALVNPKSLIVNGPYLTRSARVEETSIHITADFNATTTSLEVIGAPNSTRDLVVNGKSYTFAKTEAGTLVVDHIDGIPRSRPQLPDLRSLEWYGIDTLPEISPEYDVSGWPAADLEETFNTWNFATQMTPTSLFASDYGFHSGTLVFIGNFTAKGGEEALGITSQGGSAFAHSVWIDGRHVGAFAGLADEKNHNATYKLGINATAGSSHTVTVVVDNTGLESNWVAGNDTMKEPRGILEWQLRAGQEFVETEIDWVLTGNLGGENFVDKTRGPLNEGGFFAERHGYHLPYPPLDRFQEISPFDGLGRAGATFYTTKFILDLPSNQDNPLYVAFDDPDDVAPYRAFIFVNGWQFGRYVSNLGPQSRFTVPEGIMNHQGENWLALVIWALDGPVTPNLKLEGSPPVLTGMSPVQLVESPPWGERKGVY